MRGKQVDQQNHWAPKDLLIIDPQVAELARRALPAIASSSTHDRHAVYSLDTIFSRLTGTGAGSREERWEMDGLVVKGQLARLHAFRNNQSCSCCGITGTFFLLEKHVNETFGSGYSLVLYALDHNDDLVPLTADHILPDSLGGRFATSNFQTMCRPCNQDKAHLMDHTEIDLIRADIRRHAKDWVNVELLTELLNLREACIDAPDDEYNELHEMFERTRKHLVHGAPIRKQQTAIETIRDRLYVAPPVVPVLKWYERLVVRVREFANRLTPIRN